MMMAAFPNSLRIGQHKYNYIYTPAAQDRQTMRGLRAVLIGCLA
jgi:hypothetical protein